MRIMTNAGLFINNSSGLLTSHHLLFAPCVHLTAFVGARTAENLVITSFVCSDSSCLDLQIGVSQEKGNEPFAEFRSHSQYT